MWRTRVRGFVEDNAAQGLCQIFAVEIFIRKSIHNVFYEFVADPTEYRHNISEMLEILGRYKEEIEVYVY